jgi:hypothetical protein
MNHHIDQIKQRLESVKQAALTGSLSGSMHLVYTLVHEDVPYLLAEVEAVDSHNRIMREALEHIATHHNYEPDSLADGAQRIWDLAATAREALEPQRRN